MHVLITETKTGRLAAQIEIYIRAMNYEVTNGEYFRDAWKSAVSDGTVLVDRQADHTFSLVP